MTEFFFAPSDGNLYIGSAAYNAAMENGLIDPRDCEDLRQLLISDVKEPRDCGSPKFDIALNDDEFITPAKWIRNIVTTTEATPSAPVTQNQLQILYNRGLSPSPERIKRRAGGTMAHVNSELGPVVGRQHGRFADWNMARLVQYAKHVKTKVGGWPSGEDFQAAFEAGEGPSLTWIERRYRLNQVLEHLGFWDTQGKTEADFLEWGVNVMRANSNQPLSTSHIRCLSARRVGPSLMPIKTNFKSFGNFQYLVEDEFRLQEKLIEERSARVVSEAKNLFSKEEKTLYEGLENPEIAARSLLYFQLAGKPNLEQFQYMCAVSPKRFGAWLESMHDVTRAKVETVAVMNDLDHLIWPPDISHLVVTAEELKPYQGRSGRVAKTNKNNLQTV